MGFLSKIGGVLTGGLMGFAMGGPVGAVAGGLAGGLNGSGKKSKSEQLSRYTPEQQSALNQLLRQGMADTDVSKLQGKYKKDFERETVPMIAERFTSMGDSQGSSAFTDALSRGGVDLASQLAGLQYQGGMQKLGLGTMPQFDQIQQPEQPGIAQMLAPTLISGLLKGGLPGAGGGEGDMLSKLLSGLLGGQKKASATGGAGKVQYLPGQPQGLSLGSSRAPIFFSRLQQPF